MKASALVALFVCVFSSQTLGGVANTLSKTTDVTTDAATESSSGYEGSGDTTTSDDDNGGDRLADGQLAAIVVSSIIGAILIGLLLYFFISVYCPCPVMSVSGRQSFSPIVSLASQPIVITTS